MAWTELDTRLASIAEAQHGIITYRQAIAAGATAASIHHRCRTGQWQPVAQGVYRVAGSDRTWRQSLVAAVFSAGPGSVASHRSAAALWGLPGFDPGPLEVLRPRHTDHRCSMGRVHETQVLPPAHWTVVDAVPVTGPARTIFDLAGAISARRTERVLDTCLSRRLVDLPTMRAMLSDLGRRGRAGTRLIRRLLDERGPDYVAPASELEHRMLEVLVAAGVPRPQRQVWAGGSHVGGRVDFAYPNHGVLIEADSRVHHMSKLDFEADRRRDNWLMAAGWRVLRITWEQVTARPSEVVALVREALRAAA
ncbi:MAG TPA: type IV toxin-antitoxin system AbiEi family antitoxin domain-containing protein [Acidimicrobiales bacterium]|nr:type IV toxin-antitoxin system AbiEi family antitoxin domain-containing protein [Acidimicrobiales bacterium]